MPIHEDQLNVKLAELLRARGIAAQSEERIASGRVDIAIEESARAIAVECSYNGQDARRDGNKRIPETQRPLLYKGKPIDVAYALAYPDGLKALDDDAAFKFLQGAGMRTWQRKRGQAKWLPLGSMNPKELAGRIQNEWNLAHAPGTIEALYNIAEFAIDQAAEVLAQLDLAREKDSDSAATTALVWLNALLFQNLLHQNLDLATLPRGHKRKKIPASSLAPDKIKALADWNYILEINWHPVFSTASNILREIPPQPARWALEILATAAVEITQYGAIKNHDLSGKLFHRLLNSRKFLATNYTLLPIAALAAGLALDRNAPHIKDFNFGDAVQLKKFKIAELACGSGTLLKAVTQEISKDFRGKPEAQNLQLWKTLLEEQIYGLDVVPSAIHLTATTLSMAETRQYINHAHLYHMLNGVDAEGKAHLGSLDLLREAKDPYLLSSFQQSRATAVRGDQNIADHLLNLPAQFDVIVLNPPFTRAGGPGNTQHTGWSPLYGHLETAQETRLCNEKLKEVLHNTSANTIAGLGSAFLVLAEQYLKTNGRLAIILPNVVITGDSWRKIRAMLVEKFHIETVLTSHDTRVRRAKKNIPGRYYSSLSESTNMAEALLVMRKINAARGKEKTRIINLTYNAEDTAETGALLKHLLECTADGNIQIEGTTFGSSVTVPQKELQDKSLKPWLEPAIVSGRLLELTKQIFRNPARHRLCELQEQWERGPSHLQVKNPKFGCFSIVETNKGPRPKYPALWKHRAKDIACLQSGHNAELKKRKGREPAADEMWRRAGNLQCAEIIRTTQKIASTITPYTALGVRSFRTLKAARNADEIALNLFFNCSLGILSKLIHGNRPYLGTVETGAGHLKQMAVLESESLTKAERKRAGELHARICESELRPIRELDKDPVRIAIDKAIAKLTGIPQKTMDEIRRLLAEEPSIRGMR